MPEQGPHYAPLELGPVNDVNQAYINWYRQKAYGPHSVDRRGSRGRTGDEPARLPLRPYRVWDLTMIPVFGVEAQPDMSRLILTCCGG